MHASVLLRTLLHTAARPLACALLAGSAVAQAPAYTAEFLGPAINAAAMNASAHVVGTAPLGATTRGWIAGPDQPLAPLPLPAGFMSSAADDINDAGVIVGALSAFSSPDFQPQAAAWIPDGQGIGTFRIEDLILEDLGHWFVIDGYGLTINDARQIVVPASNDVTGESGMVLLTPVEFSCQADLGFAGPGAVHLSVCGGDLSSGTSAALQLTGAVPASAAWVVAGLTATPTPFKGGLLLPVPIQVVVPVVVDASGGALLPGIPGGGGPLSLHVQAVCTDPLQPAGFALSNALKVELLP